mgnify:CR=1 FL=1
MKKKNNPDIDVKRLFVGVSGFKAEDNDTMTFSCYGNVKNVVDHAFDVTMDGAFQKCIDDYKAKGTMPKMLWNHDRWEPPVGVWLEMSEDSKGLMMRGKFANTDRGREIYELMKSGALDSFSIGYTVNMERWDGDKGINELLEVYVKEVSIVNFACNEESTVQDIKSSGELPTKRQLQDILRTNGFSKRQAESITNNYNPDGEKNIFDAIIDEPDVFDSLSDIN